jgi:NAD(P)H-dependent flavin oxidoreductase YrpB (nitropropane dioxygenase family)|tara:strand:- start:325 stop:1362 length:1038 start_codon:yes stop_codon:yes gene_type:complete
MAKTRIKSPLVDMLGIDYPIIQGGMAPFSTANLAAAVSNAGGMGTVSIPRGGNPEVIEHLHRVKRATDRNFAMNTVIGSRSYSEEGLIQGGEDTIDTVIREKEKDPDLRDRLVLYITSGGDPSAVHQRIKDAGFLHFHMVASLRHAKKVEELGVDGIMAAGYEMGGHTHRADRTTHTFVLVPSAARAVSVPVCATGGVCDGATFAAALALGAAGVYMGTRFIATQECDFHEQYKEAIVGAAEHGTVVIPSLLGPARHLNTPFTNAVLEAEERMVRGELSQGEKTQMVTAAHTLAQETGDYDQGLFMSGMCSSRVESIPTVKDLIDSMVDDAAEIINDMHSDLIES